MTNAEAADVDYLFELMRAAVEDTDHVYSPEVLRGALRRITPLLDQRTWSGWLLASDTENSQS
ncbi:hypothetical protein LCGC14_1694920 [marine sediment metagenome]|uniref:Uncharacterized protein n=1 Tax=marine sediment metagenome TaxID=412755 RepID=A0A0F9K0B5_9ZZZZ